MQRARRHRAVTTKPEPSYTHTEDIQDDIQADMQADIQDNIQDDIQLYDATKTKTKQSSYKSADIHTDQRKC